MEKQFALIHEEVKKNKFDVYLFDTLQEAQNELKRQAAEVFEKEKKHYKVISKEQADWYGMNEDEMRLDMDDDYMWAQLVKCEYVPHDWNIGMVV